MKAKPAIDAVEHIIKTKKLMASLIKEEATVLSESLRISVDTDEGFERLPYGEVGWGNLLCKKLAFYLKICIIKRQKKQFQLYFL